ncbi:hypothetical protein ZIOFF_037125 [Zingiber officinale]|uniref:Uncharacterized protein n=1 Tax=Zingiber officinale TaxID=94328 RepID=A0A8J5GP68_ZINOF|nr:hypothetical protein ZIOFF_037125 [Zingiber officinale]
MPEVTASLANMASGTSGGEGRVAYALKELHMPKFGRAELTGQKHSFDGVELTRQKYLFDGVELTGLELAFIGKIGKLTFIGKAGSRPSLERLGSQPEDCGSIFFRKTMKSWLSCFGESSEILSTTYVVLKEYPYDPIDCIRPAVAMELGKEKGGSTGRGLYHERSKEVNLLQIYNMDSDNAIELDPRVDPNESVFPQRSQKRVWKPIGTLEWKLKRNVAPVPSEMLVLFLDGTGKGYNSTVECHLDVVEVISSSLVIPKPNGRDDYIAGSELQANMKRMDTSYALE